MPTLDSGVIVSPNHKRRKLNHLVRSKPRAVLSKPRGMREPGFRDRQPNFASPTARETPPIAGIIVQAGNRDNASTTPAAVANSPVVARDGGWCFVAAKRRLQNFPPTFRKKHAFSAKKARPEPVGSTPDGPSPQEFPTFWCGVPAEMLSGEAAATASPHSSPACESGANGHDFADVGSRRRRADLFPNRQTLSEKADSPAPAGDCDRFS